MSGCKAECMMDSHADRSLGIIVYPDGSQAEIIQRHVDAPIWETWTEIKPLKARRRLTFAPFNLLVSLPLLLVMASLLLVGCGHMQVQGTKAYCMSHYQEQVRVCEYDSMAACRAELFDGMVVCMPR